MTDPVARDPAAQPERTGFAWRRSTLAATVAAILAARLALHGDTGHVAGAALALMAAAWLVLLTAAHRRIRALDRARPEAVSVRSVTLAAFCVVAIAVCGILLVL
ncbi:DUF202 domain-containing protein [Streptomyces sp. F63]|uniref:DUF202 domain-containing protein n=1 Tax=Streptomyces sp. F63 TaxID=2824887 RepID=UPI001B392FFB|nr:DUF202 domain-containing protein [Streptomyces sp. F63]MBQ0988097.1 DUF202 domain-containing protein [Streptomyces sp. F63]